ncbi:MAG: efflux RND transporter permease subunit, partial [Pseudomonadota bacterium]
MSDATAPPADVFGGSEGAGPTAAQGAKEPERARDRQGAIAFMVRNPVAANLLMIAMFVAGYFAYTTIVQEVFPESSLDTVSVTVRYPGATPDEIEESIVQVIEEAVEAVEDVDTISSTASEGVGTVNIEFPAGIDIARALDDVKSEVDQIQTFPGEAEEPDIRELTTRQVVLRIALFGDVSERSLKESANDLEDRLSALPEVSYVSTSSVRDYQIYIDMSQEALRALGLSLVDVSRIVGQGSLDRSAGSIDTADEEVRIRTVGQNYGQADFEDIVLVSSEDGDILRVRDVASVSDGFEDADLIARFNEKPVAFVDVYRTSDERVLDVAAAVKEALVEDYTPPTGVEYAVWNDSSEILNDRYSLLLRNAGAGLILVLIAMTLFLDLRLAFWTAVGIGATFVAALFLLELAGSSINMFSLFGFILALGLVVDDAVVVGENIYAEREKGRSALGAAIEGSQRVKIPVIFAVLTSITAVAPIYAIGGTIGKIIADIPLVVSAVLLLSLVEALLVLPHHLSALPAAGEQAKNSVARFFERVQKVVDRRLCEFIEGPLDRALQFAVKAPAVVLSGALAVLIIMTSLIPAGIIKASPFPFIEDDVVTASLEMPAGTTVDRTGESAQKVIDATDRVLARYMTDEDTGKRPEFVEAVYTTIGAQTTSGGPDGRSTTLSPVLASVQIALKAGHPRNPGGGQIERELRDEVGGIPEAKSFTVSASTINFGAPVSVKMYDTDPRVLEEASTRLMDGISRISGTYDIESDQDGGLREIDLTLKPEARTLGLTLEDLAGQVRAAFFGAEAVRVQRGPEDVRVYVRLPEEERNSIADIEQFRVRVPGGFTSLNAVAEAEFTRAPAQIRREDGRRQVVISAEVNEDMVSGNQATQLIIDDIMPAIAADYPTLQYAIGGEQEELDENFGDLGPAFAISLVVIYVLLAIPFQSYSQPLVIMAAIPFGAIGALFGHLLLGISLGILSIFGIVALAGVIINGSLVMIDFFNENVGKG